MYVSQAYNSLLATKTKLWQLGTRMKRKEGKDLECSEVSAAVKRGKRSYLLNVAK